MFQRHKLKVSMRMESRSSRLKHVALCASNLKIKWFKINGLRAHTHTQSNKQTEKRTCAYRNMFAIVVIPHCHSLPQRLDSIALACTMIFIIIIIIIVINTRINEMNEQVTSVTSDANASARAREKGMRASE